MQFSMNTMLCPGEYWKYVLRSSFTQATNSTGQQANEMCGYYSVTYPILTGKGNDTYQLILEKKFNKYSKDLIEDSKKYL